VIPNRSTVPPAATRVYIALVRLHDENGPPVLLNDLADAVGPL
jgi:hypothetical protein